MVLLEFTNGKDWFKANWVFRRLAADTIEAFPGDTELAERLQLAEAIGHLPFAKLDQKFARRLLDALRSIAERTLSGEMPGLIVRDGEDAQLRAGYLESLQELLDRSGGVGVG